MSLKGVNKILVIGGSAGSLPVLLYILENLPSLLTLPVVVVLHRLKNVYSDLPHILGISQKNRRVKEPEDKEQIKPRYIYIAPQNYHLLVETDKTFSLDYSEAVHYSRPSIDVTFDSVARVFGKDTIAILLSGANQDGAEGVDKIIETGGKVIAQDPATCEYPAMPVAAIEKSNRVTILGPEQMVHFLAELAIRESKQYPHDNRTG